MNKSFKQYQGISFSEVSKEVVAEWKEKKIFEKSIESRNDLGHGNFVFYEGPPSANGKPGIHHVLSRTIKDTFCRYKSLQGYVVERKAGWDTHGLPIELAVEKELGIKKDDIGNKISVKDYNDECKKTVMRYKDLWEKLTEKVGYWVDMDDAYITYTSKYMESVWWLLKEMHSKGMLYKGHTVQPYSPAAGTGLSSHELNQPGCYRDVKDVTVISQFKITEESLKSFLPDFSDSVSILAWTTTPWTLPANTALAVGKNVEYALVETINRYSHEKVALILAKSRLSAYFKAELDGAQDFDDFEQKKQHQYYRVVKTFKGSELNGLRYEQLIPFAKVEGKAFEVIIGDYVSDSDGTGIVHIAPCYGADDARVAQQNGIDSLDIVTMQGRYRDNVGPFSNLAVKDDYEEKEVLEAEGYRPLDVRIVIYLKENNLAFLSEKYEHSYPHCWRTDKPILYFPLESWFVKTTSVKESMIELNKTINWQPPATGTGRFGNWLENLVDWNLSRSRFWGIPLPIWRTEDGSEEIIVGSIEELKSEIEKSIAAGLMKENFLENFEPGDMSDENYDPIDIHRTFVDPVVLVSASGKPMKRESDIIDVWFDSGSMPYAQLHYPFENKDSFEEKFPADFIAEGVDQTRGWFFTLHAISSIVKGSVAFKNVVSNGLVLDKDGQKMSKSKGNTVEPFEALDKYGVDPVRWYILSNAQPWDNLRFDVAGIAEVSRKFFSTLHNTYGFFALYANLDGFTGQEMPVPVDERPVLDRWILSELHTLIEEVTKFFDNYNPTPAARMIQDFTLDKLSNWYVRLNRKRFWKGELNDDKLAAYQTLHECLVKVAQLASPISPMYTDKLYQDLTAPSDTGKESIHLDLFPKAETVCINDELQEEMRLAQKLTSLVLSLREKANIRVRQPLQKIMVPILNDLQKKRFQAIEHFVLQETNIKEVQYVSSSEQVLKKTVKPNFKTLGPRFGKKMKLVSQGISKLTGDELLHLETEGTFKIELADETVEIELNDVLIAFDHVEGLFIDSANGITAALDVEISDNLLKEGIARELINRIQNLRKESGFEVTDRIKVSIATDPMISETMDLFSKHVADETLANSIEICDDIGAEAFAVEFDKVKTQIRVERV